MALMRHLHAPAAVLLIAALPLSENLCRSADLATDAFRATVRITTGSTSGTAFFVTLGEMSDPKRRHLLVTANHVLHEFSGETCTVLFREHGNDGTYIRKEVGCGQVRADPPKKNLGKGVRS